MLIHINDYLVPLLKLTSEQFNAIKSAMDEVESKGGCKTDENGKCVGYYNPRETLPLPFIKIEPDPMVYATDDVQVDGVAKSSPAFDGKCYSVLKDGANRLWICFTKQCLSNFCWFGGMKCRVLLPDGSTYLFKLPTLEHSFQLIKALTVFSEDGFAATGKVLRAAKPGDAKQATGFKSGLKVGDLWNAISEPVMEKLVLLNLANKAFFEVMMEIKTFAEGLGIPFGNVFFAESNDDKVYGWGVNEPKDAGLSDKEYYEATIPVLLGEEFPGRNVLGNALKKAFEKVATSGIDDHEKLVVGDIVFALADEGVEPEPEAKRACLGGPLPR